jgi:hypothetical protein
MLRPALADKPPLGIPDWRTAYRAPMHVAPRILVCNHKVPKRHPRLEHGLVYASPPGSC